MRCRILGGLLAALFLGFSSAARADEVGAWTAVALQKKLNDADTGPRLWLDLHMRRPAPGTLAIVRPGVGWAFSKHLSVWGGYGLIPSAKDGEPWTFEHRAWEQVILQGGSKDSFQWMLRERVEQRVSTAGDGVALRSRTFARAGHPIAGPFGVVAWDEAFVNLNDAAWGPAQGFDQNRAFLGLSVAGQDGMRVEVGYMNHFVHKGTGDVDNHLVNMAFYGNF